MRVDNQSISCALIVLAAALALVFSTPRTAQAQTEDCDGWVALHDMLPRRYPVMVQTADGPLLWGGNISPLDAAAGVRASTSETWRFDGGRWRFVTLEGPSPRYGASGAYDATRDRVVIFGGRARTDAGSEFNSNETWEFGDGQWTRRVTAQSPPPTASSAMVYDPSRHLTFLYAGSRFWQYDGSDWTEMPATLANPGTQLACLLVFDPRDNSVVLISRASTAPSWKWDGVSWNQLSPTGVQCSTAFFDAELAQIVLGSETGSWHTFSGESAANAIDGLIAPSIAAKLYPTSVTLPTGEWLTIVAPASTSILPLPTFYRVSPTDGWVAGNASARPTSTLYMAFNYHEPTHEFLLHGGSLYHGSPTLHETWLLRGETWRRAVTSRQPQITYWLRSAFSPREGVSVLMGSTGINGTLWSWNGADWSNRPMPIGIPGYLSIDAPPVVDSARRVVLLPLSGTVKQYDGEVSWAQRSGPDTSNGGTAFDPNRDAMILAGSSTTGTFQLKWDTAASSYAWQAINPNMPARYVPRMAFDPDREGVVLFGGTYGASGGPEYPRMTHFLASDASEWRAMLFGTNTPIGRNQAAMGYDSVARRIVMYGGTGFSTYPLRETWKLARGPAAVALEPVDTYVVPGETAEAFIIASGGGVIQYQWFKDGVALANSDRISGADTDTLQIQNFTSADNAVYHVTVHNPCGDDQSIAVQLRAIPACPGDFNDSGGVDAADLADFVDAYERGLMLADVDLSGGIDANDLAIFIGSFQAGGC
jgi:hypothetical protein